MSVVRSLALIAAGPVRSSFLTRLPKLREHLGPVKSSNLRLASRIANLLGAGHAVSGMDDLARSRVLLIALPDDQIDSVVRELRGVDWNWIGKSVLLASPHRTSAELICLSRAGASVATLAPVAGLDELFVLEGDRTAVREARRLIETKTPGARLGTVTVDCSGKALYSCGVAFATTLFSPLITAAIESLLASGLSHADAADLAYRLFQRSLRAYSKAGRKAWETALSPDNSAEVVQQMHALRGVSPVLAGYYYENAVLALKLLRKDASWVKRPAGVLAQAVG